MMSLPIGTLPLGPPTTNVVGRQRWLATLAGNVDAAPDPLSALVAIAALTRMLAVVERGLVESARGRGASWTVVGEQLGVSKQAAVKRFGPPKTPVAVVPVAAKPAVAAVDPVQSWDLTTRSGRTLLRFTKRPAEQNR